ncbi:MAG: hypothetical protein ACI39H_07910 [Lachnospiraceae bacterium]
MAVKCASSSYDGALDFILNLHEIRDTVRDERKKRLAREKNSQRATYQTGQEARFKYSRR